MSATSRLHMRAEWAEWAEWIVFIVSAVACAVVFSGRLQSADEIAIYALTQSLTQRGALDINVLASTAPGMSAPPFSGVGQFGPDDNFYSGKGPLPSLLAIPLIKAALPVKGDPVVAVLVLNVIVTALTALVIARYVRLEFGSRHTERVAFWTGILYVVGTMALAYSKRLFTEPVAALCLALAFTGIASSATNDARHLLAGLAFGGAIAASYSNAVLLPCFAALIAIRARRDMSSDLSSGSDTLRRLALFIVGVLPWLIGLGVYNLARFGDATKTGLSLIEWSLPYFTPHAALVRIYGLLLSPYRSLILYNPILLLLPLALAAGWISHRDPFSLRGSHPARYALFMAVSGTVAYLLFFSVWSMWWGGFNWGPRFLLPILPLWLIALAPAFEIMFTRASSSGAWRVAHDVLRVVMWAVVVLSILITTVGALADTFRSEGELARRGALSALVKPETLDASSLLIDLNSFQAVTGANQIARGELDTWWATPPMSDGELTLTRALGDVAERATPNSAVLLIAPTRIEPFLHAYRLSIEVVGLSPDQIKPGDDAPARGLLKDSTRVLLVTDVAQSDPANTTERWLEDRAYRARNEFYGDWRVAAFGIPIAQSVIVTPAAQFGDQLTLSSLEYSPVIAPGGAVTIRATWQRKGDPYPDAERELDVNARLAWFAHLIGPDGALIAQHDALIGGGYPSDPLDPSTLIDHRGILVPSGTHPGLYRVRIGAYLSDGTRLPASQAGARLPDDVVTFDVRVK